MYVYIETFQKNKKYRKERVCIDKLNVDIMENINANIFEVNNSFYEKYNPQIRKIVTRILNNANQTPNIDDCVNTVFLELIDRLKQYNETRGSISAFVAIVTRSVALNYCKSNTRKIAELIGDDSIAFLTEPMQFESDVEAEMLVKNIIKKLNEKERALFTMRFILFYSAEEIAEISKIKRHAVEMRLNRLKGKIKNFLIKGGIII